MHMLNQTLRRTILATGIILFFFFGISAQNSCDCLDLKALDKYIEKSRKEWMVPGMAIAIVKNDTVIFSRGYGVRSKDDNNKVDDQTIFAIASNTKAFTSTALAILEDQEKIDWDDHVTKYLPWFSLKDPYVTSEIRIRDLLCHRSGLETFSGDLIWYGSNYSREEVIRKARFLIPKYGFRYHYGYSNIMFLSAGEIIPVVTGRSWDDYIRENFLERLGMDRTSISIKEFGEEKNIASPHHVDLLKGTTQTIPYLNWDNIAPAGAINSCVRDMAQWIRFNLNMGVWAEEQIVSEENMWELRKMHTPEPVDMGSASIWPSKHFEGYGMGWDLYDYHGGKIMGHSGGADGMISRIAMIPEEQFGLIILTNSINVLPLALTYYIFDNYFTGESRDWSHLFVENFKYNVGMAEKNWETFRNSTDPLVGPKLELKDYCGIYGGEMYGNAEVKLENEKLVVDFLPTDIFTGDLSHHQADTFIIKFRDVPSLPEGTVEFIVNEQGRSTEMKVDIPNPDFDFTELEFKRLDQ